MPQSATTVIQLRVDETLKRAFAEAARRERTTAAEALRGLMADFVRDERRREALRQSRLVAQAPDAAATMDEVTAVQGFTDG